MKFAFIKESLNEYWVDVCCEVLQVSRSGYYAWRDRPGDETGTGTIFPFVLEFDVFNVFALDVT